MEDIKCPNCGQKVNMDYKFDDRYEDGASVIVKCEKCDTIFKLTQHYTTYYVVNECAWDEDNECGNVECENNSVKLGYKNPSAHCVHDYYLPCKKYKPTPKLIKEYEDDHGEKYVPPEEDE